LQFELSQAERDRIEAERIARARREREALLGGGSSSIREYSQAERDASEAARIERARNERERLLNTESARKIVRLTISFILFSLIASLAIRSSSCTRRFAP
jgi:hypothetical protein